MVFCYSVSSSSIDFELNIQKIYILWHFLSKKLIKIDLNRNTDQIMLRTNWLMNCSLFPQSPLLWKGCLLCAKPPLGALSLNGHKKLLASLKWGPTVKISLIKSSTQTIPCLPKTCSITELVVSGILCLLTLPYPLFKINFLMVYLDG